MAAMWLMREDSFRPKLYVLMRHGMASEADQSSKKTGCRVRRRGIVGRRLPLCWLGTREEDAIPNIRKHSQTSADTRRDQEGRYDRHWVGCQGEVCPVGAASRRQPMRSTESSYGPHACGRSLPHHSHDVITVLHTVYIVDRLTGFAATLGMKELEVSH